MGERSGKAILFVKTYQFHSQSQQQATCWGARWDQPLEEGPVCKWLVRSPHSKLRCKIINVNCRCFIISYLILSSSFVLICLLARSSHSRWHCCHGSRCQLTKYKIERCSQFYVPQISEHWALGLTWISASWKQGKAFMATSRWGAKRSRSPGYNS